MRQLEFVAFPGCEPALPLPLDPGGAWVGPDGEPRLLHVARRRWLAPTGHPDAIATLEAEAARGTGVIVDVTGRDARFVFAAPDARPVLASSLHLETVFSGGRTCAAVTLFGCPAVLVSVPAGWQAWIARSYAADFGAAVQRTQRVLARCAG